MADINPDFRYVAQSRQDRASVFKENNNLGNAYSKENEKGNLDFNTTDNSKSYNSMLKDINKDVNKGNEMQKSHAQEMDNESNTPRDPKKEAKDGMKSTGTEYSSAKLEQMAPSNARKTTTAEQQAPEVNEKGEGRMVVEEPQKTEEDSTKSEFMDWFIGKAVDAVMDDKDKSSDNKKPDSNTDVENNPKNERELESENYKNKKLDKNPPQSINPDMPNPGTSYFERPSPQSPPPGPEPTFPTMSTRGPASRAPMPQFGGTRMPKTSLPSFKFGK